MAITTIDGAIAGMQWPRVIMKGITPTMVVGKAQSLWTLAGTVGVGAQDTTLNGIALDGGSTNIVGQIPWTNPGSGNSYLARVQAGATVAGTLLLCDRLWMNGGYTITTTTAQNSTTPTWPARDANGATAGAGVMIGLEVSAGCGAAAPAPTISYRNSADTATNTGSLIFPTANSPATGSFFMFNMAAGDIGVKSVASLTLGTSWATGTINLVAYRILASLELQALIPNAIDCLTGGFVRMYNGSVPFLVFIPGAVTASYINATVVWTQG